MVFSIIGNICKTLVLCKKCNFSCCINYEDSKTQSNMEESNKSLNTGCYPESCINFERDYLLNTYPITADFYDINDIGQFITDIDGLCIHINKKGAEHIGELHKKMFFSPIWSHNLCSDDVINIIKKWQESLDNEKILIYKERRIVKNKFVYILVEAYPIFSKGRFKGMKGIMMRVTKPVWYKFDEKKATKLLIVMELKKEDSLYIPIKKPNIDNHCED